MNIRKAKFKTILIIVLFSMVSQVSLHAQSDGFFGQYNNGNRDDDGANISGGEVGDFGTTVNNTTPLGSGLLLLVAAGAGYAVVKKRRD